MEPSTYLFVAASFVLGTLAGIFIIPQRRFNEKEIAMESEERIAAAHHEIVKINEKTKTRVSEMTSQLIADEKELMTQLATQEKIIEVKLNSAKKREEKVLQLKKQLDDEEKFVMQLRTQTTELKRGITENLLRSTGLSFESVKTSLAQMYEADFANDAETRIQRAVEWAQESAVRDGRDVLAQAMYRFAASAYDTDESDRIKVAHDEIKGRIVGRAAVNIAFFEELFGVDVIFNDEPNTIIISCFNLVQREIAKRALERLMRERVINEEVIKRIKPLAEKEVDMLLMSEGQRALKMLELPNMPPDFAKLIGRLKFRTSYGQNIMQHCLEVGYFAKLLAAEIGADTHTAFLGGFFHDIGKAIDQEVGGSHDVLSKEILEKYGFSWEITHAAWTHHNAIPQETIEARIVQAADAISASRPGARAESVERYLAKIRDLQDTALSFEGVKKAFAINAGRELRVVVDSEKTTDATALAVAQNIAAKVQEKGGYPGRIKIVTIRTTKTTDYAR